ncbi:MAG TPA: heavy metal-binding domain-containing protein [Candidatus Dormibacteraeota bacterium]|nr:heavy metal-binding domain-containing protein [Candidatus Dormibacteraeota bacterium]
MRFFRGGGGAGTGPTPEQLARAERSRQMVEAGGIPLEAQERIQRQSESRGAYTSDLSVDELAALRAVGYRPLAMVLGSSLYRMGWISTGYNGMGGGFYGMNFGAMEPQENTGLTSALREARERAIRRLMLEAQGLGAEGVVGVRLRINRWEWATGMAEFTVIGTAVAKDGHQRQGRPFTSTLSGQDMSKLLASGYEPVSLVMGASAYQAVAFFGGGMGRMGGIGVSAWSNQEVTSYSLALHRAQDHGRRRLAQEAAEVGASGVVGVEIESHILEFPTGSETVGGRIVEWVILGTAVSPLTNPPPLSRPKMVIPLRP